MSRIIAASTVIACSLLSATAAKADPIGSYAGGSIGFDRTDSDLSELAAEGVFSVSDNFQIRATIGDGLAVVAPTGSISVGQWRFAAGPGLKYSQNQFQRTQPVPNAVDDAGEPIEEAGFSDEPFGPVITEGSTRLIGLAVAERAIGEYGVVFAGVTFSNQVSGSIGVGLRF